MGMKQSLTFRELKKGTEGTRKMSEWIEQEGTLIKYEGRAEMVELPPSITIIGPKAFLSCKTVQELKISGEVTEIKDWAFAHMKNLRTLRLPGKRIAIGRQVFLDCPSLSRVYLEGRESCTPGINTYLAMALKHFPGEDFLPYDGLCTTEGELRWKEDFLQRLEIFLNEPDDKDYVPAFIGWFDVEDIDDQKARYMKKQRLLKLQLAEKILEIEGFVGKIVEYIEKHFAFFLRELPQEQLLQSFSIGFYKILFEQQVLTKEHMETILGLEIPLDPEVRGFMIAKLQPAQTQATDFFQDMLL